MVMPKKDDKDKLSERVAVRLTVSEHERLTSLAKANHMALGDFIRAAASEAKIAKPRSSDVTPPPWFDRLHNELLRQGGLLKHVAIENPTVDKKELADVLDGIKNVSRELALKIRAWEDKQK